MWKLVIEDDEGKRMVVHLSRDEYGIGRKEGHAIRLTQRNVSRDHAFLRKGANGSSDTYLLSDTDSYNGVFVNGVRLVDTQEMIHGDLIQVGDYRVLIQNEATEAQTVPDEPEAPGTPQKAAAAVAPSTEDLKSTVVPGRVRMTGAFLLQRPNRLVVLVGPNPGTEYPLDADRVVIGRAEDAAISINHNSVSRAHCEIHRLSEGRYEIIDKESQNGVRVNGRDATRGIIEAGDIIELGDVRVRFVGAGEVFVPNSTESQQLMAITDRKGDAAPAKTSAKGSVLSFVLLGLLLGGVAVGIVYALTRPSTTDPKTPGEKDKPTATASVSSPATLLVPVPTNSVTTSAAVTTAPVPSEVVTVDPAVEAVLGPARRFAEQQKWDELYAKLESAPQPVRKSDEYGRLASMWSAAAFQKAEGATGAERRAILRKLERASFVDQDSKKRAAEMLAPPPANTPAERPTVERPVERPTANPGNPPPANTPAPKPTAKTAANTDAQIEALYQAHKFADCARLAAASKTSYAISMVPICNSLK
jgi:ABC transport system ATP-binding/permease protein